MGINVNSKGERSLDVRHNISIKKNILLEGADIDDKVVEGLIAAGVVLLEGCVLERDPAGGLIIRAPTKEERLDFKLESPDVKTWG